MSAQQLWTETSTPGTPAGLASGTSPEKALPRLGRDDVPRLLLKPEEAALALGVSRSTLYELLANGTIESVHIGKSRRVPVAALEDYVERLRVQQNSCARQGL